MIEFLTTFLTSLSSNQFIAGGIMMQCWMTCQSWLKFLVDYVWSYAKKKVMDKFYHSVTSTDHHFYHVVMKYCLNQSSTSSHLTASYVNAKLVYNAKPETSMQVLRRDKNGYPYYIWITLSHSGDSLTVVISMYYWQKNVLKEFCDEISTLSHNLPKNTHEGCTTIATHTSGYTREKVVTSRPLGSVILPPLTVLKLVNALKEFIAKRKWYIAHSVPYRFGVMFDGLPGTGKSSLAFALAGYFGLVIYTFNSLSDVLRIGDNFKRNSILMLEDIDSLTTERTIIQKKKKMLKKDDGYQQQQLQSQQKKHEDTFSELLNFIDGINADNDGRILIMTTNHKERLDPALVRPFRVNYSIKFEEIKEGEVERAIHRFYHCSDDWLTKNTDIVEHLQTNKLCKKQTRLFMKKLEGKRASMSKIVNHFVTYKNSFQEALDGEFVDSENLDSYFETDIDPDQSDSDEYED